MVLGIQIAGFLFGLFMIYYSFMIYKRKEFTAIEFGLLLVFWLLFIMVALFPYFLDPLVKSLNFARTFDLLVISGFIILIAVVFYIYKSTRRNEKRLEKLVRDLAMKKNGRK